MGGFVGRRGVESVLLWVAPGRCPLYPDGRQDNTHLNVHGARTLARMFAAELPAVVPELAAHLDIPDLVVAKDGSGDFFTVAEAVAAIPDFCRKEIRLRVMDGIYREKISIPYTKRNVWLEGRGRVTITWNDYASKIGATGHELGTSGSSTVLFRRRQLACERHHVREYGRSGRAGRGRAMSRRQLVVHRLPIPWQSGYLIFIWVGQP